MVRNSIIPCAGHNEDIPSWIGFLVKKSRVAQLADKPHTFIKPEDMLPR